MSMRIPPRWSQRDIDGTQRRDMKHRDETTGTPEYKVTAVRIEHHKSRAVQESIS